MRAAPRSGPPAPRAGVTLLEVLAAIFITGMGTMPLLELFPLGALSMARATGGVEAILVAEDAEDLSADGKDVLARTRRLLAASLAARAVDRVAAAGLGEEYADLAARAAALEDRVAALRPLAPHGRVARQVDRSVDQLRDLRVNFDALGWSLRTLGAGETDPLGDR